MADLSQTAIDPNVSGAFFGNPNIQRQGARARALAQQRDVNTLPDPRTYAAVSGLFGEAPDQMGFSVLNPQYESIMQTARPAFALGTALGLAPALAPFTKGLPVGASIKDVSQQIPTKAIRRFDDGGLEVGYGRGDSKILVTVAPQAKNDRMLSASLENIGGYPSGTGDATMAYVDALESVIKDARGRTVYWDGFTSESIQSNKARAIYDRLKAAGIPFEKNVFEGRSKNAVSLTQEQLLNIDFNKVRNNLFESAVKKQSPQAPQTEVLAFAQQSAGPKKTWDAYAAQKAKMLEDMGRDPKSIWQETGTWRGADGQLRQEIMP
jgi:hypothetical protein